MTATKSGESDLENTESTSKRGKPTMVSSVFHGAEPSSPNRLATPSAAGLVLFSNVQSHAPILKRCPECGLGLDQRDEELRNPAPRESPARLRRALDFIISRRVCGVSFMGRPPSLCLSLDAFVPLPLRAGRAVACPQVTGLVLQARGRPLRNRGAAQPHYSLRP